jgi:hypothetical protein
MKNSYVGTLLVGAVLLFFSIVPATSFGQSSERVLPIRPHLQHTLVWCWGASAAMVIEYMTGNRIEDCEVLSAYDRRLGGPGLCCQGDSHCLRGAMPGEIERIFGQVFNIHGRSQPMPATFSEIVDSIDNGKPIVIWLWRTSTSAHVVVIAGYRMPSTVVVLDPMSGRNDVDYQTLRTNWLTGVWRDTIFVSGVDGGTIVPPPPSMATACVTMAGPCPMMVPVPIGSPCQCQMPMGIFPGQAH